MDAKKENIFLADLNQYIRTVKNVEALEKNSLTCSDVFDGNEMYEPEEKLLQKVLDKHTTTTEQGDSLELLMKSLFERIKFIDSVKVTNRDITIGQIDLQLRLVGEIGYKILGLVPPNNPLGLIGECKNFSSGDKIGREDIEKMCWRSGKSGFLSFYISRSFTSGALNEIAEFNLHKENVLKKHHGVYIAPISLDMVKLVIEKKINFCHFVKWLIHCSMTHSIATHLRDA